MTVLTRLAGMAEKIWNALPIELRGDDGERAKPLPRRARTLADFWRVHHAPHLALGRAGTRKQQAYRWTYWVEPSLGPLRWSEINKQRIATWVTALRNNAHCYKRNDKGKLAPRTIHNIFSTLSAILSHAVALDYLEHNPATAARRYLPAKEPSDRNRSRPRALSLEDARLLCSSPLIHERWRDEYLFAVLTCARRGEVHGMRWRCVFLDTPTPYVRIEKSHNGPTKTGKTRDVPIHPELLRVLREIRDTRKPSPDDLVFPSHEGKMQGRSTRALHIYRALRRLSLPPICYHGLRHTGATLYRAAGVRRDDVAEILGHSATVTDLYAPPQIHILAEKMTRLRLLTSEDYRTASAATATTEKKGNKEVDEGRSAGVSMQGAAMHNVPNANTASVAGASNGASILTVSLCSPNTKPVAEPTPAHAPRAQSDSALALLRELLDSDGGGPWDDFGYPR